MDNDWLNPFPDTRTSKTIHVTMHTKLLEDVDVVAKLHYISRSEFIRRCIAKELERTKKLPPQALAKGEGDQPDFFI